MHSRAFARRAAKTLIPGSPIGVRALVGAAQAISLLPAGVTRRVAKLNDKGVRLYDSMQPPVYPVPA
jgi:hypothetical protein